MKIKQNLSKIISYLLLTNICIGDALAIEDVQKNNIANKQSAKSRDIDTDLLREKANSYNVKGDIESSEKLEMVADTADRIQQKVDNIVQQHEQMTKDELNKELDELGDENKRLLETGKELRARGVL